MRTLFFCARDIRDYLKGRIDTSNFEKIPGFKPNLPELIDAPIIQKILSDLMQIYPHCKAGCDAPIYGETGIDGLRLDFNFGLRLEIPVGNFHVRIGDDAGQIFFDRDISDVRLISFEKYFIRWQVEIFRDGEKIFSHTFNPEGYSVLFLLRDYAPLGDTLALFPTVEEFRRQFNCEVCVIVPEYLKEITANLYPEIKQVDCMSFEHYAIFFLVTFMGDLPYVSVDCRNDSMERSASRVIEVNNLPAKPIFKPTASRICAEPYVCIGVQTSTPTKCWLYPGGWEIVVDYLKSLGYRVFCIDKEKFQREGYYSVAMPQNAEDLTGDFSIMERANMLYHAEFFIGLSSGLAWVANAVDCPVVMISGFSKNWHEFYTPYRVINRLVCNGCFNDVRVAFMNGCPYHKGTARELECQKKISPRQVITAIERLIIDKNLVPPIFQ